LSSFFLEEGRVVYLWLKSRENFDSYELLKSIFMPPNSKRFGVMYSVKRNKLVSSVNYAKPKCHEKLNPREGASADIDLS
jgi:hypothetical protein